MGSAAPPLAEEEEEEGGNIPCSGTPMMGDHTGSHGTDWFHEDAVAEAADGVVADDGAADVVDGSWDILISFIIALRPPIAVVEPTDAVLGDVEAGDVDAGEPAADALALIAVHMGQPSGVVNCTGG